MNSASIIEQLGLEPHLEGGYFRRSYTAPLNIDGRPAMSSIYYLLNAHSPIGHLHRNRSDILHFWQGGCSLQYTLISPDGELSRLVLGDKLSNGEVLQMLVPGGYWKATELLCDDDQTCDYALISEAVCPGFDFSDHQLASATQIQNDYAEHWPQLSRFISPASHNTKNR